MQTSRKLKITTPANENQPNSPKNHQKYATCPELVEALSEAEGVIEGNGLALRIELAKIADPALDGTPSRLKLLCVLCGYF
jgi:hypothetical protein